MMGNFDIAVTETREWRDQPAPTQPRLATPTQAPSSLLQSVLSDLGGHFFRVPAFPALPISRASSFQGSLGLGLLWSQPEGCLAFMGA